MLKIDWSNNSIGIAKQWFSVLILTTVVFSQSLLAHTANINKVAWQACDAKDVSQACAFENANGDVYHGSCQLMSDSLMCVRSQAIEKAAAATNDAVATIEKEQLHEVEHLFQGATVVAGPSMVDCILSGGTSTRCFSITVKAEPTDTVESCAAAARPNVDPAYQNYCVQCLPEYMDEDASVTYTIPVNSFPLVDNTQATRDSGSGIAFNGVRLDGPAPVEDILSDYTLAPFDDCGGHVNLNVGYHYHAATDCLLAGGQSDNHDTVIGLAMDGRSIYSQATNSEQLPNELDACGGHTLLDGDYHYHAGEQGSNAILTCMTAEVGCVSNSMDEECDASSSARRGEKGQAGGGRPGFTEAAKSLGVSEAVLIEALGGPPPNIEKAAEILQIDVNDLEALLPKPSQ